MARGKRLTDIRPSMEPIEIELGGKIRVMQFTMNSLAELETRFGSIDKAFASMSSGESANIGNIRTVLWASLIHSEAVIDEETGEPIRYNISPFTVGNWVTTAMLPKVMECLMEAINRAMPEVDAETLAKAKAQQEVAQATNPKMAKVVPTPEEEEEAAKN